MSTTEALKGVIRDLLAAKAELELAGLHFVVERAEAALAAAAPSPADPWQPIDPPAEPRGSAEGRLAPRSYQPGDALPNLGAMCLVSGPHADIESDQHRGYMWRQVVGYAPHHTFICLQTPGCWPTVERTERCWFAEIREAAAPGAQPAPSEPAACQACGDTATRHVPEEATEHPGPYCNNCGPSEQTDPLLDAYERGQGEVPAEPTTVPPGCDITLEGIAQACENSFNWLMHGRKTGPCIAAPQFAEAARLLRAQPSAGDAEPSAETELHAAAEQALETLRTYVQTYNDYWERGMDILEPEGGAAVKRLAAALASTENRIDRLETELVQARAAVPASSLVELLKDAIESVEDYRAGKEFGAHDRKLIGRLKSAIAAAPNPPAAASDTTMWAMHIAGPDDLFAAPDRAVADAACVVMNAQFKRHGQDDMMRASVVEWPHGYEAWRAGAEAFQLQTVAPEAVTPSEPPAARCSASMIDGKWEGAEEWMPLAWELCANECGEDACTELIWEGGAVPEPWGDRWLKYEDQAKEMIAMVRKSLLATASSADARDGALSDAGRDVLAERARQISAEGWTPEHDDEHAGGALSMAAITYLDWVHGEYAEGSVPINWPWAPEWFKPSDDRRNLVKAGALILAEIERLDRAAIAAAQPKEQPHG